MISFVVDLDDDILFRKKYSSVQQIIYDIYILNHDTSGLSDVYILFCNVCAAPVKKRESLCPQ